MPYFLRQFINSYILENIATSCTFLYFCAEIKNVLIERCESREGFSIDLKFLKKNIFTCDFWWKVLQTVGKNGRKMYFIVK